MTDKEKIIKYLNYKGISKNKFYLKTGLAVGFLDSGSSLGVDKLKIILDNYHDLNPEWFLMDNGEMLKVDNSVLTNLTTVYPLRTDNVIDEQEVPLYEIEAVAGLNLLSELSGQNIIGKIKIPNLPKSDGAVYIRGDSMYPILKAGDIVIYKQVTNPNYIIYGEMYLISFYHDNDTYLSIKFIQKSKKDDDHICLVSYNEHHKPMDIKKTDIQALAIVKASVRFNTMS